MLIKVDTHEYPVSETEFVSRFPDVSFPQSINYEDFGYAVVFPTPQPETDWYHIACETAPVLTDKGHWEQRWDVVEVTRTPEEVEAKQSAEIMAKLAEIESRYAQKLAALDASLINALWVDGTQEASTRAALKQKKMKMLQDQDDEINALLIGG